MKAIEDFCEKFGVRFVVPDALVLRAISRNLYLFTPQQAQQVDARQPVVGGGIFLGSIGKYFEPSAQFIDLFLKDAQYAVGVDEKTAWLYLCGRDIIDASGIKVNLPVDTYVLVKDKLGQLLGYGIVCNPLRQYGVVVKNLYDKGSLLRREMTK